MILKLHGADLVQLTLHEAAEAVAWLLSGEPHPDCVPTGMCWAVAQATDTFVWGLYRDAAWLWTSQAANAGVRPLRWETLLEVRAFCGAAEILLWRTKAGFGGRVLRDAVPDPQAETDLLRPAHAPIDRRSDFLPVPNEEGELTGQVSYTADPGFWRREEGNGRITVTPAGKGVLLRNYLEQCRETGMLRIAATRFCSIIE